MQKVSNSLPGQKLELHNFIAKKLGHITPLKA